jgi:hypothetical protein
MQSVDLAGNIDICRYTCSCTHSIALAGCVAWMISHRREHACLTRPTGAKVRKNCTSYKYDSNPHLDELFAAVQ